MIQNPTERARGRPRSFDEDEVLRRAIALFSDAGFSSVAVSKLTDATGLSVGSLYKAYGDKEGLFAKALDRYIADREAEINGLLEGAQNGRDRIAALLRLYMRLSQGKEGKLGCLWVAGVTQLPEFAYAGDALRKQLSRRRRLISDLVAQGQADGSVTSARAPATVAELLLTVLYGMRVLGKAGVLTKDAEEFIALAMTLLD